MKIATIIGARPQFIKSAPISKKIESHEFLSEIIIHTGQHFDKNMSKIFFNELGLPNPNFNLNVNKMVYGKMVKRMFDKICKILFLESVDGVLVYGDTNSTLAGCLSAKKFGLPVFHVESGLRSFDRSMLEESNRLITDHLSSVLFCPSQSSVDNLSNEDISGEIVLSGDVMYDAFLHFDSKFNDKNIHLNDSKYVLATIHRRENIHSKKRLGEIIKNLNRIHSDCGVVMPMHPHTRKIVAENNLSVKIKLIDPQGYLSMMSLLKNCEMVITDSGGLQKESFFAKKKCLIVRDQTEWVELIDEGFSTLCKPEELSQKFNENINVDLKFSKNIYGNGNSSGLIIDSITNFFKCNN